MRPQFYGALNEQQQQEVIRLFASDAWTSAAKVGLAYGVSRNTIIGVIHRARGRGALPAVDPASPKKHARRNALIGHVARRVPKALAGPPKSKPLPPELRPVEPLIPPTMEQVYATYASAIVIVSQSAAAIQFCGR